MRGEDKSVKHNRSLSGTKEGRSQDPPGPPGAQAWGPAAMATGMEQRGAAPTLSAGSPAGLSAEQSRGGGLVAFSKLGAVLEDNVGERESHLVLVHPAASSF